MTPVAAPATAPDKTSKDGEHGSSPLLGTGLSDASLHSLGLTAGTTSSVQQQQSEPLPPPSVSSKSRPDLVTEASQTPDSSTGTYRSLTLQYSPRKRRQPGSKSKQVSPTSSKPSFLDDSHVPFSPKSVDSQLGSPVYSGKAFSLTAVNRLSSTLPPTDAGTDEIPPPVPPKQAHSEGILKPSTPVGLAEKTRSLVMQVSSERLPIPPSQAQRSPRSLVPWIQATIKKVSSAVGSPRSLVPFGFFTASRQSPDQKSTASQSKFEETSQFDDVFPTPRLPWASLILTLLLLHAHWKFLHKHYPERCASVATIVDEGRWERVVLAAFHHANFNHLASNAVSFFFKGLILETALGATYFVAVVTIVTVMVGLINVCVLKIVYSATRVSCVATMCAYNLAGVIVALGILNQEHFGKATIHYSEREVNMRYDLPMPIDMFLLSVSSKWNLLPMVSGVLVGLLLAKTAMGKLVVGIPYPRRHLYLASAPKTPVTYLFVAAVATAHLYGPYAGTTAMNETKLAFRHPFWRPLVLSPLYVGNVYELAYVLLSLLAIGQKVEQHLGHYRFLVLAPALLLAVNTSRDGLKFVLWKHLLAFRTDLPPPAPHVGDCSCDLVGVLLALKAVLHTVRPDAEYQIASQPIGVHFWPGMLFELMHLHYFAQAGSSFAHVPGVLFGLAVARFLRHRRGFGIPKATRSSTVPSDSQDYLDARRPSFD
ncbi:hypothetical protein V5799_021343 [Amblyomma americanum]|uniref:Peptidase S54 rhomboid domain-containing protein n=1 Tax=Amblyomma americanum TaxID=6943 RepID=A0AAQ4FQ05_AMBAM